MNISAFSIICLQLLNLINSSPKKLSRKHTSYLFLIQKSLPASRAHSHRALSAQLASLSAPRARDLIVALRAPFFLDLALRARSRALRIHLSLFIIIWYWSSNQFYNNITDDVNYTFSQSHSISFWILVKQEIQFT